MGGEEAQGPGLLVVQIGSGPEYDHHPQRVLPRHEGAVLQRELRDFVEAHRSRYDGQHFLPRVRARGRAAAHPLQEMGDRQFRHRDQSLPRPRRRQERLGDIEGVHPGLQSEGPASQRAGGDEDLVPAHGQRRRWGQGGGEHRQGGDPVLGQVAAAALPLGGGRRGRPGAALQRPAGAAQRQLLHGLAAGPGQGLEHARELRGVCHPVPGFAALGHARGQPSLWHPGHVRRHRPSPKWLVYLQGLGFSDALVALGVGEVLQDRVRLLHQVFAALHRRVQRGHQERHRRGLQDLQQEPEQSRNRPRALAAPRGLRGPPGAHEEGPERRGPADLGGSHLLADLGPRPGGAGRELVGVAAAEQPH
mmetsp:Transcript_163183/g.523374  ORF Transcript_163183/g.523374 Transcript_163183/m.523374 type:complete len:362 (-) Transcript_163183:351-1436(-)